MAAGSAASPANGLVSMRHLRVNTLVLLLVNTFAPLVRAFPLVQRTVSIFVDEDLPKSPKDASLWVYLSTAIALVLLGGAFAGLTIALMGQDEIYLQVIAESGEGRERVNAAKVLRLLKRGKHWVLVTLLLSNVITNETLPIVLDRSLGGGWPAVLASTILIVIFGEVVPQSICVRYGLPIGAWTAPLVLGLMWLMAPVAWPTAKLLDKLLGEDHGTTYKKAGLKTLVTLHKTLGPAPEDRLNQDEVTIISAVLDLKSKPVGSIMTPMKNVFTMSVDTVLDERMMNIILSAGYSRIPIHTPDNPKNFVGMLLVKMLITYDPEDAVCVREFALATLPETRPETSCLDIINFFQEGKSHMVLVSEFPGDSHGAVGVVTLEDVMEELIGEEIIDESDVFIDVHKAIRRMAPAPRTRVPKGEIVTETPRRLSGANGAENGGSDSRKASLLDVSSSPQVSSFMVRRRSSGNNGSLSVPVENADFLQHLKHLGPSNVASRPKSTRINTVKIKQAIPTTIHEDTLKPRSGSEIVPPGAPQGGIGEGLLDNAGREARDGVHSLAVGYGTMTDTSADHKPWRVGGAEQKTQDDKPSSPKSAAADETTKLMEANGSPHLQRSNSRSTVGSLLSRPSGADSPKRRNTARSGSISQNIVDMNGVRKMVLETASSSDSEDKAFAAAQVDGALDQKPNSDQEDMNNSQTSSKKKRKKRGKKKKGGNGDGSESQPLLGEE